MRIDGRALVESKADTKLDTRSTLHATRFWAKAAADWNARYIVVADAMFQLLMHWLNVVAPLNIEAMLVALAVFQLLTSPLKEDADSNAPILRGKGNADKTKDLFVCSCGIAWRWRWRWRWRWTTQGSFVNRCKLCGVRVPPVYVRTCWPLGRCSTSRGFG